MEKFGGSPPSGLLCIAKRRKLLILKGLREHLTSMVYCRSAQFVPRNYRILARKRPKSDPVLEGQKQSESGFIVKLDAIKASSFRVKWNLREVHKVTQWKDGCVYRTKSIGLIVCKPDYKLLGDEKNIQIGAASTSVTRQLM